MDLPLHPELGLMGQRRRGLLLRAHAPPPARATFIDIVHALNRAPEPSV